MLKPDVVFHDPPKVESTYLRIFPLLSGDPEALWRDATPEPITSDPYGSLGLPWGRSEFATVKRDYEFAPELLLETRATPDFIGTKRFHIFYLEGLGPIVAEEYTFDSVKDALQHTRSDVGLSYVIPEVAERIRECGHQQLADLVNQSYSGGGLRPILVFSGEPVSEADLESLFGREPRETIPHEHQKSCSGDCTRVVTTSMDGVNPLYTVLFISATEVDQYRVPVTLALQVAAISGHGPVNQRRANEDLTMVEQSDLDDSDDVLRLRPVSAAASASINLRFAWQRFKDDDFELKPWFDKHAMPFLKLVETDDDRAHLAQRVAAQYARLHARQSLAASEELRNLAKAQLKTAQKVESLLKTTAAAKKASVAAVAVAAVLSAAGLFGALAGIPGTATLISPWPDVLAIALMCVYLGVFFALWLYRRAVGEQKTPGQNRLPMSWWASATIFFASLPLAMTHMSLGVFPQLERLPHYLWVSLSLVCAMVYAAKFAKDHDFS